MMGAFFFDFDQSLVLSMPKGQAFRSFRRAVF
jgi:hypothetical protein